MTTYILRRLPSALAVLILGAILVFSLVRLIPGDPAESIAGPDASAEAVEAIRAQLGLDEPWLSQFVTWIGSLLRLDPGRSLVIGGQISELISEAAVNTLTLAITALLLAVSIALVVSVGAELINRRWARSVATTISTFAVAIPSFVSGVLFIVVFGVLLEVLPAGGTPRRGLFADPTQTIEYLVLPALCLALPVSAALTRFLRDALSRELDQPYVTTARALGISRPRILLTQVLPNALPSSLTVLGMQFGHLLGGAVIVEVLFAWNGLGHLAQQAIVEQDYPVVQVLLIISLVVFVVIQLVTDVLQSLLDPRIRIGR